MTDALIIPAAYTIPFAAIFLAALALHARAEWREPGDRFRQRTRLANAAVIALAVPLLTVGSSFIDPQESARAWMLIWLGNLGLLLISLGLAMLDAMNTIRHTRRAGRDAPGSIEALAAEILSVHRADAARGTTPRAD